MDSSHNNNSYGYDENLFISPPADFLRCGICSLILRNPIQIVDCGHKYCGGCFQRWQTSMERNGEPLRCPIDRNVVEVNKVFEDVAMKRVVGSLQVRCDQADRGCDWNGELTELETHTGKCPYLSRLGQKESHDDQLIEMVRRMGERVEKVENLMMEKEKEVLHHKFTVMEMKTKYEAKFEELEQVKNIVEEVRNENMRFRSEQHLKEQAHEQCLTNMELKLSQTLKTVDLLVKNFEEMQTKNSVLEQELKANKEKEEITKQEAELKIKTNSERVSSLEDEVRRSEELFRAKKIEPVKSKPADDRTASLSATRSQQPRPQPNKFLVMHPRSERDQKYVLISNDNRIQFKGNMFFGTVAVTLPLGVIGRNMKAFYELVFMRGGEIFENYLNVGWATQEFQVSRNDNVVGSDQYSYSYEVSTLYSWRRHKGTGLPWGKTLVSDGQNVIGVAIDMVNGLMLFSLNGQWDHPMGVAFENIGINKNFFPAISFYGGELQVNFGERNFTYGPPDDSYSSIVALL